MPSDIETASTSSRLTIPISPTFSNDTTESAPRSEATSDEQPDLGAFTTVLWAWSNLGPGRGSRGGARVGRGAGAHWQGLGVGRLGLREGSHPSVNPVVSNAVRRGSLRLQTDSIPQNLTTPHSPLDFPSPTQSQSPERLETSDSEASRTSGIGYTHSHPYASGSAYNYPRSPASLSSFTHPGLSEASGTESPGPGQDETVWAQHQLQSYFSLNSVTPGSERSRELDDEDDQDPNRVVYEGGDVYEIKVENGSEGAESPVSDDERTVEIMEGVSDSEGGGGDQREESRGGGGTVRGETNPHAMPVQVLSPLVNTPSALSLSLQEHQDDRSSVTSRPHLFYNLKGYHQHPQRHWCPETPSEAQPRDVPIAMGRRETALEDDLDMEMGESAVEYDIPIDDDPEGAVRSMLQKAREGLGSRGPVVDDVMSMVSASAREEEEGETVDSREASEVDARSFTSQSVLSQYRPGSGSTSSNSGKEPRQEASLEQNEEGPPSPVPTPTEVIQYSPHIQELEDDSRTPTRYNTSTHYMPLTGHHLPRPLSNSR